MQINNPLQMNDWEIRKFLKVVLTVQFALWSVIGLDAIGLQIPILRQLAGFIYLSFVPGILTLRILKLHKLGNIETLLYSVGLSIATLMFTGLFMNSLYPFLGISRPISAMPLIITISAVVLVLCILSYVRDKEFSEPRFIDIGDMLSPPALFLCLIPFLAVFGTYLVNFHHTNILLMFMIVVIVSIVLLIAFDKFISTNLYPLAVFIIAISLLFHRALISMYLKGWDIHLEYYLSNLVMENSYWDSTIPTAYNAMLSVVMLAPIFSNICDMSFTWVFKIIYPLLFSLVPLGLYRVFQKQTDDKIAFLACFFFVLTGAFYGQMLQLARQQIAELFLVLLILSMIDKDMDKIKRSFLFIVFGVSLAVSHYGLSYIYMFCLIAAWLILVLAESPAIQRLGDGFYSKFSRKSEKPAGDPVHSKVDRTISSTFVLLFITFTLTWYMYVSSSSTFDAIVHIGDHIASTIFTDFLNPEYAQGLDIIIGKTVSPLHSVLKYLHLISQFFIFVGVITLMLKREEMKFEREYATFSYMNTAICFGAISIPYFASALNTTRLYHIVLIFLAPFCVIGGVTIFRMVSRVVSASWTDQRVRSSFKVLSAFLAIFLLFSSGWVYEVAEGYSGSISLSQESITKYGDTEDKTTFFSIYHVEGDIFGVKWISKNRNNKSKVYADLKYKTHILVSYGMMPNEYKLTNTTKVREGSYIYLGYPNVHYGMMYGSHKGEYWNTTDISPLLYKSSKIYNNGDAQIYYR